MVIFGGNVMQRNDGMAQDIQHAYQRHDIVPKMNNEFDFQECHAMLLVISGYNCSDTNCTGIAPPSCPISYHYAGRLPYLVCKKTALQAHFKCMSEPYPHFLQKRSQHHLDFPDHTLLSSPASVYCRPRPPHDMNSRALADLTCKVEL
jgi:hypothetical protein